MKGTHNNKKDFVKRNGEARGVSCCDGGWVKIGNSFTAEKKNRSGFKTGLGRGEW